VETSTKLVYDLIGETPPNGKGFGQSVKHILEREEQWNRWKNDGCPSLKPKDEPAKDEQAAAGKRLIAKGSIRKRKRKLGDQIKEAHAAKKFLMGNANLTKLWNLCPNNLDAAAAPERDFLPTMDEWMLEAAEQLDPAQQVEETYRKVNDGQWGWRALRLLVKKSGFFYTYGHNKPIGTVPEYLTERLKEKRTRRTLPARRKSRRRLQQQQPPPSAPKSIWPRSPTKWATIGRKWFPNSVRPRKTSPPT